MDKQSGAVHAAVLDKAACADAVALVDAIIDINVRAEAVERMMSAPSALTSCNC